MKYYNIKLVPKNTQLREFDSVGMLSVVDNDEALLKDKLSCIDSGESLDDYEDMTTEITVNEATAELEKRIVRLRVDRYLKVDRGEDTVSVKEYAKILREGLPPEDYFSALWTETRMRYLDKVLRKKYDMTLITISAYDNIIERLFNASSEQECDTIVSCLQQKKR